MSLLSRLASCRLQLKHTTAHYMGCITTLLLGDLQAADMM